MFEGLETLPYVYKNGQSRYFGFLKVAISLLLLALLLYKSNVSRCAELIGNSSPAYLLAALLVTVLSVLLSAYKWQLLVVAQGFPVPLRSLVSSYFVGLFFNNFLPTSIGGDVVRAYDLRKLTGNGPAAAASVVAERVLASFTLGLVVLCGIALGSDHLAGHTSVILIFIGICFLLSLLVFNARKISLLLRRFEASSARKLYDTLDSIRASVENKPVTIKVLLYSFIFQALVVLINIFIIRALSLDVPIAMVFLFIPIIFAITMLPVSMNGLGVREVAYAYFFSQAGLSTEESIAISIYFFLVVTLVSLIGGVIFALRK